MPGGDPASDLLALIQADLEGRYRIERELGHGGMATVYLAHDLRHGRRVAVKVMRPELAASPERFVREIRLTAGLQHPLIVPLLDSGALAGPRGVSHPWYVMPYVEGESLRSRLARERQLPVEEAVAIARDVASALAYAHGRGIVHRDIKPENILLSGGHAVVADFGLARAVSASVADRLTGTGLALGTPAYMSPEQAAGDPEVGPPADIYALGCVLYELLAGAPPFTGPTSAAVIARRISEPPPRIATLRPSVPRALDMAVTRALATVPADRFATARQFDEALAGLGRSEPAPGGPRRPGAVLAAAALGLLLAAGAWLALRPGEPAVTPSASWLAVLPFEPSGPDTALVRLGRDLVFTLSASLDGLGGIRVLDAHSVLARARAGGLRSIEEATAFARRFGAGGVVHGSLVRVGPDVRLDFALLPVGNAAVPAARGSVTASPDSVAALTDSATRSLLREVWARGSPPTPSLDGALKTRSVAALRAFLQGEGEIAGGQWDSAATSYERAMAADPRFWLAYARYAYAKNWALEQALASVTDSLVVHRAELPERERLTTEAIVLAVQDSVGLALERAREASERYPGSWFGWLLYGDQLLHHGPLLGRAQSEARAALERAIDLNPDLIPAWEHLMLVALLARDTAASAVALQALARLDADSVLSADGYGNRMLQFTYLDALVRGDAALAGRLTDSLARNPEAAGFGSFYDPFDYGMFAHQARLSELALRTELAPARRFHQRMLALSAAARGAWDSALALADATLRGGLDPEAAVDAYRLAVVGAWVGALDQADAVGRRAAAVAAAGADASGRAEVAWLDGLAAVSGRDRDALARARAALARTGAPGGEALGRSLGAFDAELRGDTEEAGATMARLEWEQARLAVPGFTHHPWATAVNRLAAGRWLGAGGDLAQAGRLLAWVDGPFLIRPNVPSSLALSSLVYLERARIAQRSGHSEQAARFYGEFLRRYDQPVPRHRHLVEEARTALGEGGTP